MDLRSRINKTGGRKGNPQCSLRPLRGSPDGSKLRGGGSAVGSSGGHRYDMPVKERAEMAVAQLSQGLQL